ncbi:hypothetical protein CASFOL_022789 [Castilleja foliolosa]|uniref:RNase H type-1 domain-containing protein n=1 Tax=Castilleja foliolosa TaxID=1961234 RepID=A0ABD3CUU6_9LAMI
MVLIITRQAKQHWLSIFQASHTLATPSSLKLIPPPMDYLKANVDATFLDGCTFSGVLLRDSNGSVRLACSYPHIDSFTAECLALFDACILMESHKIQKVCFESDCLNAITFIVSSSNNCFWTGTPVIDHIKRLWSGWPHWNFKFVQRGANNASHALAKWAFDFNFKGIILLNSIPLPVFSDLGSPLVKPLN